MHGQRAAAGQWGLALAGSERTVLIPGSGRGTQSCRANRRQCIGQLRRLRKQRLARPCNCVFIRSGPANALSAHPAAPALSQPVRSFKIRGALNKMARLSKEQLARGVICSSAGNHAQGVAMAARALVRAALHCAVLCYTMLCCARCFCGKSDRLHESCWGWSSPYHDHGRCRTATVCPPHPAAPLQGCQATICMPVNSPEIKINAVRKLGGTGEWAR